MKQLKAYTIIGIIFTIILGSLSHFFYEWSNNNFFVGLFAPINESTWEHMKLLFFPMLLYSMVMIPKLKENYPCIHPSYWAGILVGTLLIPVIFYTYTGILGYHIMILDIGIFLLSVIIAFYSIYALFKLQSGKLYITFIHISMHTCHLFHRVYLFSTGYSAIFKPDGKQIMKPIV